MSRFNIYGLIIAIGSILFMVDHLKLFILPDLVFDVICGIILGLGLVFFQRDWTK